MIAVDRPTFAAVVLTLNEEAHIRECLEHLAWCDERILVDMQSEDRTREEAAGLATKILVHDRTPNFDTARNPGFETATSDWILSIDADELVPAALATRLRAFVTEVADAAGIRIPRMNYWSGRPVPNVSGFPDYQLRCFRRGTGFYSPELNAAPNVRGRVVSLPIEEGVWLRHVRKNASIADLVRKWDAYAETEARDRWRRGDASVSPARLLWTVLSTFRARFITLRGYRDGMAGLVLSVLWAFYRFEVEAKMWEVGGSSRVWDAQIGRLSSVPRLVLALGVHGARRLGRRMFRRL